MSLAKKLSRLMQIMFIPLMLLVIYLICSLISCGAEYDKIVNNIIKASAYNASFRNDLDYCAYRMVINEKNYSDLLKMAQDESYSMQTLKNPYNIIKNAREGFQNIYDNSVKDGADKTNLQDLEWILKSIDRIEETFLIIESNVEQKKSYSANVKLLENGVYLLTETTQNAIHKYIENEAEKMEEARVKLESKQSAAVTLSLYGLIVILIISVFFSKRIVSSIVKPIKELCAAAELVAKGDFTSKTEIKAGDEIQSLTKSFNDMKFEIGRLIDDVKREQANIRIMELKLLQQQINPHFLYNTLDAIVWLAESGKDDDVVAMVTNLSSFFRTTLSDGKDIISISDEISHIESYLNIQKFRYRDILDYEIDVDDKILNGAILKLTLQPIVENAIYHGIKNKRGGGKIFIKGFLENDTVVLETRDNGIGMTKQRLTELKKNVETSPPLRKVTNAERKGFGLANVNERIKMRYGAQYGISFDSEKNNGTVVTVRIPFTRKTDINEYF